MSKLKIRKQIKRLENIIHKAELEMAKEIKFENRGNASLLDQHIERLDRQTEYYEDMLEDDKQRAELMEHLITMHTLAGLEYLARKGEKETMNQSQLPLDLQEVDALIKSIDMINKFEVYAAKIDGFIVTTDYMFTGTMLEALCKTFNVRIRHISMEDKYNIKALFERRRW